METAGRFGKRGTSVVPLIAAQITGASGTAAASRPMPPRARSSRPSERVPSGKTPIHAPARSSSTARSMACESPLPRSIGICPMPLRIGASGLTFHREDFASART